MIVTGIQFSFNGLVSTTLGFQEKNMQIAVAHNEPIGINIEVFFQI